MIDPKIALAMIVKGSDEEVEPFYRCLGFVASYVDGIFITVTHKPGEEPSKRILDICKAFNAHTSLYEWHKDFGAARNFNFSQVPKEYTHILWLDADDAVRGIEKLHDTVKAHPNVDAFILQYLYAFDEHKNPIVVHWKTQVVKNDGCVEWVGRLHEDFRPTRKLQTKTVKGIERIHLSDDTRFAAAKTRNLEVSEADVAERPDDPRAYWNLGNSLKALGREEEAIRAFSTFLEKSRSDDEKYVVRLRRAESYWKLGRKQEAIDEARYAIGLKPEFPDAYFLAGSLFFEGGQLEKARDHYLMGLVKPKPYHEIVVYNPRDYDYVPMMNLAKVYYAMRLPQLSLPLLKGCLKIAPADKRLKGIIKEIEKAAKKEDRVVQIVSRIRHIKDKKKLATELEKVPDEFKAHPAICNIRNINFVKEESSGKDLAIFCGFTEAEWTPDTARTKGIGGSEEAVIHLSELLAERGWNVTVYNNCGHKELKFGRVTYKPFWTWNHRDRQDVVVLWRTPRYADYDINTARLYVDLHDVIPEGELNSGRLEKIDRIFVKSQFHRSLFPNVPDEKFTVIPNGIDAAVFEGKTERDSMLMANTSSPDRSLSALLDCYAEVKGLVPEAKLKWAYGWEVFDVVHGSDPDVMAWKQKMKDRMAALGVEELGRISHPEVAKLYAEANLLAYPTEFAEIDCISLTKAMAAGAVPVTTDFAALGEKQQAPGVFIHSAKTKDDWARDYQFDFGLEDAEARAAWVREVVRLLTSPPSEDERRAMRDWAKTNYDWPSVADRWHEILNQ